MATNENLPPNVIKQLAKELKNLDETPPEGIKVGVDDDNFSTIYADIEGPGSRPFLRASHSSNMIYCWNGYLPFLAAGTPYENGVFRMKLILSHDFPHSPPKGYFLTKIFHPNIATNGEICVDALKKDWNPSLGLRHVLMVIRCLLIEPFPESALNEQAAKMLLENYEEYAQHARIYTGIHALKSKPKIKTGAISESTAALNVDQLTNSAYCVDPKNIVSGAALQPPAHPSSLIVTSSNATRGGNNYDQSVALTCSAEESIGAPFMQKKELMFSKIPCDKKKMDARKRSLKRL